MFHASDLTMGTKKKDLRKKQVAVVESLPNVFIRDGVSPPKSCQSSVRSSVKRRPSFVVRPPGTSNHGSPLKSGGGSLKKSANKSNTRLLKSSLLRAISNSSSISSSSNCSGSISSHSSGCTPEMGPKSEFFEESKLRDLPGCSLELTTDQRELLLLENPQLRTTSKKAVGEKDRSLQPKKAQNGNEKGFKKCQVPTEHHDANEMEDQNPERRPDSVLPVTPLLVHLLKLVRIRCYPTP